MTTILALDTSSGVASVAVYHGQVLAETSWRAGRHHSKTLLGVIDSVLKLAGVERTDLEAIALASGPGSYSGLRVGASVAIGLGLSLGIEVAHVPTLDILALAAGATNTSVRAAIEVGRGRYASALFGPAPTGFAQQSELISTDLPALLTLAAGECSLLVADVDPAAQEAVGSDTLVRAHLAPIAAGPRRAGFLAELAQTKLSSGAVAEDAGQLIYLPS
ncbi:MAG: tRNA (adenosine(37)-N6)-threonylcarbamoyltransferase complex dimerization subunit type 1 TsaB [Chloroflexi bacterium]|nr:tRNA (adenosine(37)-N6)-threonylcarbamoyltransferase complex dimerization subunit type 1 TsaB [Chloroflexota bacterium]